MKIVRLYTGADNESHFEDGDMGLNFNGCLETSDLTGLFSAPPPSHLSDYHPVPKTAVGGQPRLYAFIPVK